jgi:hypothetical protein
MNRLDTAAKIVMIATLLTAISVFARATPLTLIALVLGGILIVLGSLYSYRPGAMIGLTIVAMNAASSIQLDSLLEISTMLTAILGLLIPLFLLALHALGTEQVDIRTMSVKSRPAIMALSFCLACILITPLTIGMMGLILPAMTVRLSGTAETAIVLLILAIGSILLTRRTSARKTIGTDLVSAGSDTI